MLNRSNPQRFQPFRLSNDIPVVVFHNNAIPATITYASASSSESVDWREEIRCLRSSNVVLIERMLRNHRPHDILNHLPENIDWRSKTFKLALKVECLILKWATTRADYLNERTLHHRVKRLCRCLVRSHMYNNAMAKKIAKCC
ncbi:hypothetical protein KXD40_003585 [Peronospora effusa]|uniref:Uncharacterized protein n=1 Tax=Peronospora effusa TaxID=542832 RepID=A0A3M6VPI4_9STRA|nr:hypothetical protein DD238_001267 [Peronospora effusa]RQM17536.1 hypothetical protein DD237_001948 [Peronospora effusa]UIZ22732.1 hypothetical protein KXD40_003585 [Peronospora effusa]CAI5729505.1 unnamed protein product [Peronospora effusa]